VLINGFSSHHHPVPDLPMLKLQNLTDDSLGLLRSIRTAILVQADIPESFLHSIIDQYGLRFSHLILIANTQQFGSLWVTPCDIGGVLGLRIHQNLISEWQQKLKRALDIGVVLILSLLVIPLVAVIALLVRLDSRGSVFYSQDRIGRKGSRIRIWKFRTMVVNGDDVLAAHFAHNPEDREEWLAARKLKCDPRVTRVGYWLRKFSLDELPQMWNVFAGDMSLVGPRPIVDEEIYHYGSRYKTYLLVKPGLTGLWQISGRNNLDYPTRIQLDDYYVRNWSIWFDFYILARTPSAMLTGNGAY
jgi:Undecaprenyl-phosphate galactose phosphotransferase WbaP